MRPVIAICSTSGEDRNRPYVQTIRSHGGRAVLVTPDDDLLRLQPQGLLLTGGGDLSKRYYAHRLTPAEQQTLGKIEPEREGYERQILQWAAQHQLPTLGICRGCQMLNIFAGGTLIPDIPLWSTRKKIFHPLTHRQPGAPSQPSHAIQLNPRGRLYRLFGGSPQLRVNSSHHQAVRRCGKGLTVTARAPDGIIEAIEDLTRPFWIGVQFHPERMWRRHLIFANLFRDFLEKAHQHHP